jgi:hypothetical protein
MELGPRSQVAVAEFLQAWAQAIADSGILDCFDPDEWSEYLA